MYFVNKKQFSFKLCVETKWFKIQFVFLLIGYFWFLVFDIDCFFLQVLNDGPHKQFKAKDSFPDTREHISRGAFHRDRKYSIQAGYCREGTG